jgi:thioredoxin reductase (NADPH)
MASERSDQLTIDAKAALTSLSEYERLGHLMLTIEEVSAVPLFSALPTNNLERLARTSADLHLNSGEFAIHEGGEPALFAVLSGKIEVLKMIDGIERHLGWRGPGAIFGEVPIALGSPFPGGYRAAEPSRVMRVDLQEYYTIAAASKDVSMKVSALARKDRGTSKYCRRTAPATHNIGRSPVGHCYD